MTAMAFRPLFLISALVMLSTGGAWAQPASFQGAWLEEGQNCGGVFVVSGKGIAFRRPANGFVAAFVIRGQHLATPMAHCRIGRISPEGGRQVMQLSCTTSISTNAAHAVFALRQDGGLDRYSAGEDGLATRYRRCTPEELKTP